MTHLKCNRQFVDVKFLKNVKASKIDDGIIQVNIKNKRLASKLVKLEDNDFVRKIIMSCDGEECALKEDPITNYWDVQVLSDNTFLLKKKI